MELETIERKIPSNSQQEIHIKFKGRFLKKVYAADLVCYEKIIVEIKAMNTLTLREEGQVLNYLKATGMKVGVLINFGHFPNLEWKRLVLTKGLASPSSPYTLREDETIYQMTISED
jgi:GxxExxY protein